ncbi:family 20 glycosylhydrolase [Luteimonas sp. M1R5S18]|uniref:beta-N-acetylhexosaminidase n=1 Tax=Luteimonas rhizosphaericola TaxID=3042024 RepID=A0ABT6JK11_9GAMM|nr:family 20 glycosylhydrolase [Luteimonas rhizosphaericola]MDH5830969.1 family 20 glycosylhydrolase [Luteimonas rhizosphaericola]
MNPIRRPWRLALTLSFCLLAACDREPAPPPAPSVAEATARPALIPAPASVQTREGSFRFDRGTHLVAEGDAARRVAVSFAGLVATTQGVTPALAGADTAPAIAFVLDPSMPADAPEAYVLEVAPQGVRVAAADERGLFYGAVTLWQLLSSAQGEAVRIPALLIEDAPRFGWRGLMLDSARHFQSVEQIKQLLDAMAWHKLNVFHWHLTDDQGWRIEIPKYPKLMEVAACRIPAGEAGTDPATGQTRPYCGYYTQDQIRDIVAYAADRHITVVPEFDMPGHVQAVVAAYPEYGSLGDTPAVSNEWGVHQYLFNVDEPTFDFIEDVLDEIVALFPAPYVHIGGDEAVKDQWEQSERVQARMAELGIADETALQSWFVKRLETYLEGKGKRLLGWDEILDGGLPPQATVMSWRGTEGGIAAARAGHDVVMTPAESLYLDYLQTGSPNEPPGRPAQVTLQTVYEFEPVPAVLTPAQRRHILGVQANLWTEHLGTWPRMQHALFPRVAALAETAWSPAGRRDYADFLTRLPAQLARYRAFDIAHAQTPFEVLASAEAGEGDAATVTLENPLGYAIRYTTDGRDPDADAPLYEAPLQATLPVEIRAAAFAGTTALAPASRHAFDAARLRVRSDEQMATCPDTGRLLLRLEDDGPPDGERAIFNVTIFRPCWLWAGAELDGIASAKVRLGRLPYYFQLAHDEPARRFEPAQSPHGELLLRTGGCEGEPVASLPLPEAPGADGFIELDLPLPDAGADVGRADLCLIATGDTRPTMWVLDRMELVPR